MIPDSGRGQNQGSFIFLAGLEVRATKKGDTGYGIALAFFGVNVCSSSYCKTTSFSSIILRMLMRA